MKRRMCLAVCLSMAAMLAVEPATAAAPAIVRGVSSQVGEGIEQLIGSVGQAVLVQSRGAASYVTPTPGLVIPDMSAPAVMEAFRSGIADAIDEHPVVTLVKPQDQQVKNYLPPMDRP